MPRDGMQEAGLGFQVALRPTSLTSLYYVSLTTAGRASEATVNHELQVPVGWHPQRALFYPRWSYPLFPKQIRENDQWDVPGGDREADPDRPHPAGAPVPRADFRATPDQGYL